MTEFDPIARFRDSLARARRSEGFDPERAALATANAQGEPSVRFVLVKSVDPRGFVFFTNLTSRKARELLENSRAALAFHWSSLGEQVRVEGQVERVSDAEADAYFATRPRGSQLGAWASQQSAPIASREELEQAMSKRDQEFAGRAVPRPPFWGGFRLVPSRLEFWHDRSDRLHDRHLFSLTSTGWSLTLLSP